MAQFELMIPFLLVSEAGLPKKYLNLHLPQMFEKAKLTGFANDPDDSGGATMCGVTIATYTHYRRQHGIKSTTVADLKHITFQDWCGVLKSLYWDKCRADLIDNQMVAVAIVDWMWGSGAKGIVYVQRLLGVADDGKLGPVTLAAINAYRNQRELFNRIQHARNEYHARIAPPGSKNAKFLNGWNRRVARITFDGFDYGV